MPKQKKSGFKPGPKKTGAARASDSDAQQPRQEQQTERQKKPANPGQPQERVVSPTVRILQKLYGETAPDYVWPDLVDEGGYVVLGCEVRYDRSRCELSNVVPPEHTWCRWGWDMGVPVRFASLVDAEMFVKSLSMPDERGRILSRSYAPMVFFTGANPEYSSSDDALPRKNYYEDED